MSVVRIETQHDLHKFARFGERAPKVFLGYMSGIASKGRTLLRKDLLSGQAINLKTDEKDKLGRHLVNGRVVSGLNVVFSAYFVNLFERGRKLRDGSTQAPKYIITKQFKNLLNSKLQTFADDAMARSIAKEVKAL